ncbi:type I restriction enzyme HsdR N-terminal domain-containing protein [Vicingus serpentipes]|uniref:Type I restriction enzyme HsdR N-terminal domain-containing protein n=1 Tax=Vicingus serpentipes TaxID=1926625 RepID=A0A5C6RYD5_9FLAO|nr:type I restriction enzyme HsdR N-terminal domain-containing protein [Vicingus serpentipes]TXB66809.1 type I restriction enzyme HsdR N-terminal domain-containing protein [Vicingus serpentipes]
MLQLNLPSYPIKLKEEGGKQFIFDFIRKKYLVNTPEEWVRQNFIQFLLHDKKYPASLIAIEKGLKLNELQKRADAVVYDKNGSAIVLIEFKAPKIKITEATFEQISRYNVVFKVPYLIVSNGLNHYCCKIDFSKNSFEFIKEIPSYSELDFK